MEAMRTGSELNKATKPFVVEDRARSWRLLLTTLVIQFALYAIIVAAPLLMAPAWPLQVAAAIPAGLVLVRLFIFYHDYHHGALLKDSGAARVIMTAIGYYVLTVPSVWRETHNYHHKHNSKLIGSSIGSFPIVSMRVYNNLPKGQQLGYRIARHPLTIFLGYIPVFALGMCVSPFLRDKKKHWGGPVALVIQIAIIAAAVYFLGTTTGLLLTLVPNAIACGSGAYLFYAQHNFPDMQLKDRRDWDYTYAALHSSSMFDMNPVMHWLTGNIGFHHVHHLNHRIPFYRLPEAMDSLPELQSPGRVTWSIRDTLACLRLGLWDPDAQQMISFDEAKSRMATQTAATA